MTSLLSVPVAVTEPAVIPFHGTHILAIKINGEPYVILRPALEAIGLNATAQVRKIQQQRWSRCVTSAVQVDDQVRNMIVCDLKTFLMALATISANRVKPEVRPLLEAYQDEAAEVIEAYFNRGVAVNPRVAPEQMPAVINRALTEYEIAREKMSLAELEQAANVRVSDAQLRMLNTALSTGLLDEQWCRTKAQVIAARGLGEQPMIAQADLPLYVEDFMRSKGVSKSKVSRFAGAFGKKVISQAELENVEIPGKRTQEAFDGSIREITAWTKEHEPLFERAWNASYATDPRLVSG